VDAETKLEREVTMSKSTKDDRNFLAMALAECDPPYLQSSDPRDGVTIKCSLVAGIIADADRCAELEEEVIAAKGSRDAALTQLDEIRTEAIRLRKGILDALEHREDKSLALWMVDVLVNRDAP
jgi:hypothetical protein